MKYVFMEHHEWYGNGCDCCEPEKFIFYNIVEGDMPITGTHTRHHLDDILVDVLIENGLLPEDYWEVDYEDYKTTSELEQLLLANGIQVEIITEEDKTYD